MRRLLLVAALVAMLALPVGGVSAAPAHAGVYLAQLSGAEEAPPVETDARGVTVFRLSPDGESLRYTLLATNIEHVTMAHIHLEARGENGPVVAWLFGIGADPDRVVQVATTLVVQGTISADDLVGPLAGASFDDLLAAIEAGNTYVNVHTERYPGGEIRGQIYGVGAFIPNGGNGSNHGHGVY